MIPYVVPGTAVPVPVQATLSPDAAVAGVHVQVPPAPPTVMADQAMVPSFFTEIVNPADADAVADVTLAWRLVDIADAVLVNSV